MRVLAHHEMRMQRHGLAGGGKVVERAHRHVDLVADAGHIEQHLRGIFGYEGARKTTDHLDRPRRYPFTEKSPSLPPCAWQIAQASASAASGLGSPGSASSLRTMCCTCSFFAWPLPTTACFTWSAVYSATGRPAITAAQIAVPRAWPSSSVDCGLTLTKTFSIETSCGRFDAMISAIPSRMHLSRVARSPEPDLMQPLVT